MVKVNMKIKGEWDDDLSWCPSQCYLPIEVNGEKLQIYLRWRWQDPWTAQVISPDLKKWIPLDVGFFKDSELDGLKKKAVKVAEHYFLKGPHE